MARILPTTTIQRLCSPEWIAKTYSEYMLDCANNQLELVSDITEAASDEDLGEKIDQLSDIYNQSRQDLLSVFNSVKDHYQVNLPVVDAYDPQVIVVLQNVMDSRDPDMLPYKVAIATALDPLGSVSTDFMADQQTYNLSELFDKYDVDTFCASGDDVKTMLSTLITNVCNNLNINGDSHISLDNGFIKLKDLAKLVIFDVNGLPKPSIPSFNSLGVLIENINSDSRTIFEQLKASASSCIAWGVGFASMAVSGLSDKLNYFESQIKTFISDTTEKFASSVNLVRSRIAEASDNILSFFAAADSELGLSAIKDDLITTSDDTDVYAYTGCSPWSAFSTKGAAGIAQAVGKTCIGVCVGVFNAAKNLLTKLWGKVRPYVMALTNDPEDIGVCDTSDKSYTVTNWTYHAENLWMEVDVSSLSEFIPGTETDPAVVLHGKIDKWISIDTFFAEIQFKITQLSAALDQSKRRIRFDYRMKPKCLNYRAAIDYGLVYWLGDVEPDYNQDKVLQFLQIRTDNPYAIQKWEEFLASDQVYPEDTEDERYIYMGFMLSLFLFRQCMELTGYEINQWDPQRSSDQWRTAQAKVPVLQDDGSYQEYDLFPIDTSAQYYFLGNRGLEPEVLMVPTSVNNLDFIKITSGFWEYATDQMLFDVFWRRSSSLFDPTDNTKPSNPSLGIAILIYCYIEQQIDRKLNPSEYLYLPYYNDSYELSNGRFKIKTDADNTNIVNVIATALIIIAVVVTVIVLGKTLMKIRKNKKIAKLSGKIGVMDDSMWKGGKLTTGQAMKYSRWKRKLSKIEGASSGLAGSGSAVGQALDAIKNVQSFVVTQQTDSAIASQGNREYNSMLMDDVNANVDALVHLIKG